MGAGERGRGQRVHCGFSGRSGGPKSAEIGRLGGRELTETGRLGGPKLTKIDRFGAPESTKMGRLGGPNLIIKTEGVCRLMLPGVRTCAPFEAGILHSCIGGGGGRSSPLTPPGGGGGQRGSVAGRHTVDHQDAERQGVGQCWAGRARKRGEACGGRPKCGGVRAAETVTRPLHEPAQPPVYQPLGSANAETTPAGTRAAAADRTHRPNATCEGKNG